MTRLRASASPLRQALLAALLTAAGAAQGESQTQRLEALRQEIGDLEQRLSGDRQRLSAEQTALKTVEQEIAAVGRQLRQLNVRMASQQKALDTAEEELRQLTGTLATHRRRLAQQLRANYRAGQQETLKLLLNLNQPAQVGRNLTYYTYLNRARLSAIDQTQDAVAQVDDATTKLARETDALLNLQQTQRQHYQTLQTQMKNRAALVAKLNTTIETQEQTLGRLVEDETRLLAIIKELNTQRRATPAVNAKLGKQKGRLKWPSDGRILHGFGSARSQGQLHWQGVLIDGEQGQDIEAIAPGEVVFADWIRGYGLTLIVDHGGDYMSIYGHNQSLFKDIGDSVASREVIASLGNSGGNARQGLYFEMRYRGKPVDPARWCR